MANAPMLRLKIATSAQADEAPAVSTADLELCHTVAAMLAQQSKSYLPIFKRLDKALADVRASADPVAKARAMLAATA